MAPRTTRKRPADTSCDNLIPSKMNTAEASQMTSAEAKQLGDQLKELETRIDQKFVGIDGSIQLIGGSILDNGDSIQEVKDGLDSIRGTALTSKGSRQGYLRASFNIKNLTKACYSGNIRIAGSTCCFYAMKSIKDKEKISLSVYFQCERDSDALIYDVEYTIRFLGTTNPRYHSAKQCFDEKCSCSGWASFILWSELIDKTKGFIDENGNFTMHVQFLWDVRMNIQVPLRLDYSASNFLEPDCTLVIEGQKIPVCKALMMIHSAYFKTMFSREFREKNQDNIELKEVLAVEFVYLLKVVYPSDDSAKDVNGQNVECLLRLADFFQMKIVTERCANYLTLCSNTLVNIEEKLLLAQTYGLSVLLDGCIAQYKTMEDLKRFLASGQYYLINSDIKLRVLDSVSKGT